LVAGQTVTLDVLATLKMLLATLFNASLLLLQLAATGLLSVSGSFPINGNL
jgi:hypothetical protein